MSDKQNTLIALYVHIPFCVRKCHYCDFNSFESESETIDSYLDSLGKEIDTLANQHTFTTIYIGGGTPTVLSVNQLRRLLHQLYSHALSPGVQEYTIEANPGTLTVDKVRLLKEYGIDRISLGVQSFRDEQLKFLGRIHSGIEAKNTFELLRNEGFKNINIDLIFGCPGQSLEDWEKDMQSAVTMNPEHISAYSLTYEEGTSLVERMENGMFRRLDEDIELEMYRSAMDFFQRNGYNHYEISNFARHGYECSHNQVYWNNNEYIGVGTGAFSFVMKEILRNT